MQNILKSAGSVMALGFLASDTINAYVLSGGVAKRITVPTGANIVKFASAGDFYVRWHASLDAAIPVADVTDGSASEYKPTTAILRCIASFSIIAPAGCIITASFYG
jgi:hypothetical protein